MSSKQDNSKYDFYRRTGATPPSVDEHGTEQDLEMLRKQAGEHTHRWIQIGPFLECQVGPVVHGIPTPSPLHILTGTSPEGLPQYKLLTTAREKD